MPAISPASIGHAPRKTPCPHCGKPYRTLLKRSYGIKIDGGRQTEHADGLAVALSGLRQELSYRGGVTRPGPEQAVAPSTGPRLGIRSPGHVRARSSASVPLRLQ